MLTPAALASAATGFRPSTSDRKVRASVNVLDSIFSLVHALMLVRCRYTFTTEGQSQKQDTLACCELEIGTGQMM